MKYVNNIILFLALVGLTGCDPTIKSTDLSTDPATLQKNAIVVSRVHAPFESYLTGEMTDLPVQSFWRRLDNTVGENKTRYVFGRTGFFSEFDTNGFHEHMIAPGKYKLEKLVYTTHGARVTTIYTLQAEPYLNVEFEVKPGDIVYLGDIQVKKYSRSAQVVDNFTQASSWFKANHPEITKPLEKRIIKGLDGNDSQISKLFEEVLKKVIEDEKKKLK